MTEREIEVLVQRMFDSDLRADELAALEGVLASDQAVRDSYLQHVRLHNVLELHYDMVETSVGSRVIPIDRLVKRQRFKALSVAASIAVLFAILGSGILWFIDRVNDDRGLVANFNVSPGAVYEVSHDGDEADSGSAVLKKGSRLVLKQGVVEMQFASGVKSIAYAPIDLTLRDDNIVYLNRGRARFTVPAGVKGFSVDTEEVTALDLGTGFGVYSDPDDFDEVHVFTGEVQVTSKRGSREVKQIHAGEALVITSVGKLDSRPLSEGEYPDEMPQSLPHYKWSFDKNLGVAGNIPNAQDIEARVTSGGDADGEFRTGVYGSSLEVGRDAGFLETNWKGIRGSEPRSIVCWVKVLENHQKKISICGWGTQLKFNEKANLKCTLALSATGRYGICPAFSFGGLRYYAKESKVNDGKWHHIAAVYEGGDIDTKNPNVRMYVDGERVRVKMQNTSKLADNGLAPIDTYPIAPLVIGAGLSHATESGIGDVSDTMFSIDELYIFQGAISEGDVRSLMNKNAMIYK
ncbi:FecR family protein [Rubritalea squalenifaciens DSM 18772]|uniref:FecR family protein n=1 Tax=Rubritalea squalenifaciens DSM 18772 TaxID=1123071 RepID=A0A1M6IVU9_9BACT|nr:LamG-like jellyroll fold domain-containing protein [Rubritalea squalenifaciens]SHJ38595.1 FecR family protein [Rubritalea squalenifaciens DSM 18772]